MPILSSVILENRAQPNGDRDILERHSFDDGHVVDVRYRAGPLADAAALMQARVAFLEAQAADDGNARVRLLVLGSAWRKAIGFVDGLSNAQLSQSAGMTAGEIAVWRNRDG